MLIRSECVTWPYLTLHLLIRSECVTWPHLTLHVPIRSECSTWQLLTVHVLIRSEWATWPSWTLMRPPQPTRHHSKEKNTHTTVPKLITPHPREHLRATPDSSPKQYGNSRKILLGVFLLLPGILPAAFPIGLHPVSFFASALRKWSGVCHEQWHLYLLLGVLCFSMI